MIKNPTRTPLGMRVPWHGTANTEAETKTFAHLTVCAEAMYSQARARPCAMRLHAVDAYDLTAHRLFRPRHAVGQVLGRFLGMSVILDPDGIAGQAELVVCPGCQHNRQACVYTAVAR